MRVRADFDQIVHLLPEDHEWVPSPLKGVERVMLDRIGDEVAVATSIVRYAEGATFTAHEHALGEEFIVLDGEFGDSSRAFVSATKDLTVVWRQMVSGNDPNEESGDET